MLYCFVALVFELFVSCARDICLTLFQHDFAQAVHFQCIIKYSKCYGINIVLHHDNFPFSSAKENYITL